MAHYRNTTDQDQVVIGHGIVKAGASFEAGEDFTNPNFEKAEPSAKKPESKKKDE